MSGIPDQCNLPDRHRNSDIKAEAIIGPQFTPIRNSLSPIPP